MNDPEVNLNILKIPRVNSRSLRGLYEVNSSLIQNAPIELIFDMNNIFVMLHMLNFSRGYSRSQRVMRSLLVLQHILTYHKKANVNIICACIPVSTCRHRSLVLSVIFLESWEHAQFTSKTCYVHCVCTSRCIQNYKFYLQSVDSFKKWPCQLNYCNFAI